jgi:hypothetical protein
MALIKALACQILGIIFNVLLVNTLPQLALSLWIILLIQGIAAAAFSRLFLQPIWWVPIHLCFLPAAFGLSLINIPAWLYLLIFCVLALVFWGTFKGDVPLFLSSASVANAVIELVKRENAHSFAELGAGVGSVVIPLAINAPVIKIQALERAPLPWLILRWRCRMFPNLAVQNKSLWDCEIAQHDLVFAFLSPLFMRQLGEKVRREMRSGSLFVSSSFPVPDWQPESIVQLKDQRETKLYCYRI